MHKTNPHVGTGQSSKIRDRFVGPYRVIRLKGDTNYIIQHLKGGHRQCVHRNRLRPCYQRRKDTADEPTADNQDSDPASEPETDSALTVQQEVRWNTLTAPEIEEFECEPMDVDRDQEFGGDRNQDEDPDANNDKEAEDNDYVQMPQGDQEFGGNRNQDEDPDANNDQEAEDNDYVQMPQGDQEFGGNRNQDEDPDANNDKEAEDNDYVQMPQGDQEFGGNRHKDEDLEEDEDRPAAVSRRPTRRPAWLQNFETDLSSLEDETSIEEGVV